MIIHIKYYLATIIEITAIVIAGYAIIIATKYDYFANNPKIILLLILSPGPIFFLYFYISFVYVYVRDGTILKRNFSKKQIINKDDIEKIVVVTYESDNKIEQIQIYKKDNGDSLPLITLERKQFNLKKLSDALIKYGYNLTTYYF